MHSLFRSTIRSSTAGRWTPAVPRSTSAAYPPAIAVLQAAGDLADNCQHRPVQYLNNVLEQEHRAIKRRINASQHFRSFWCAWRTIARYGDPYDSQRPGVRECGRCRSTASLYSRCVRRDGLKFRSSTPTFASTTKLQHIPPRASGDACLRASSV